MPSPVRRSRSRDRARRPSTGLRANLREWTLRLGGAEQLADARRHRPSVPELLSLRSGDLLPRWQNRRVRVRSAICSDQVGPAWEALLEQVSVLGGNEVSLETLDLCALENGFFSVRHASAEGLTPLELQLQWRVSARKRFPGATAIEERGAKGMDRRLTHFVAREGVKTGDPIRDADGPVGQVTAATFSPGIGGVAGMAPRPFGRSPRNRRVLCAHTER